MTKGLILALRIAGHLAYMVVIPLFLFGGIGLLADRRWHTLPLYLLVGIGLALVVTLYWVKKQLTNLIK